MVGQHQMQNGALSVEPETGMAASKREARSRKSLVLAANRDVLLRPADVTLRWPGGLCSLASLAVNLSQVERTLGTTSSAPTPRPAYNAPISRVD